MIRLLILATLGRSSLIINPTVTSYSLRSHSVPSLFLIKRFVLKAIRIETPYK